MKAYVIIKHQLILLPTILTKKLKLKEGDIISGHQYFYGLIGITNTKGRALKSLIKEKQGIK